MPGEAAASVPGFSSVQEAFSAWRRDAAVQPQEGDRDHRELLSSEGRDP